MSQGLERRVACDSLGMRVGRDRLREGDGREADISSEGEGREAFGRPNGSVTQLRGQGPRAEAGCDSCSGKLSRGWCKRLGLHVQLAKQHATKSFVACFCHAFPEPGVREITVYPMPDRSLSKSAKELVIS